MKRFLAIVLTLIALLSFAGVPAAHAVNGYGATALTGGTAGCLDAINGATLTDGDKAFVTTTTQFYVYNLDASSATAESSPSVISPDTNAGTKRWELVYIVTNGKGIDEGKYAADAQASDTYVITLSPVPAAYYTGMQIYFTANTANTGAATLNVNALGAKSIVKNTADALQTGDIEATQIVGVVYDGTNFQMMNPASIFGAAAFTAGDTVYATAASTLAKLAIGAANTKSFVNAAGTAPEWAAGLKIGTFSRDMTAASGDVAITGVGFKPTIVLFFGTQQTSQIGLIAGLDDGTLHYCVYNAAYSAAGRFEYASATSIALYEAVDKYQTGYISTLGADGFTITWVKAGTTSAGSVQLFYLALR